MNQFTDAYLRNQAINYHRRESIVILMKFWSLAAPHIVQMKIAGEASDEIFVKIKTFFFHCWNVLYKEINIGKSLIPGNFIWFMDYHVSYKN